jgi:hypothetical protein
MDDTVKFHFTIGKISDASISSMEQSWTGHAGWKISIDEDKLL